MKEEVELLMVLTSEVGKKSEAGTNKELNVATKP